MQSALKQPDLPKFEIYHANTRCLICLYSETPELNQAKLGQSPQTAAYEPRDPGKIVSPF